MRFLGFDCVFLQLNTFMEGVSQKIRRQIYEPERTLSVLCSRLWWNPIWQGWFVSLLGICDLLFVICYLLLCGCTARPFFLWWKLCFIVAYWVLNLLQVTGGSLDSWGIKCIFLFFFPVILLIFCLFYYRKTFMY